MEYKIKLKELLPQKIMSITITTDKKHLFQDLTKTYMELYEHLKTHNAQLSGTCDAIYHTVEFNPQIIIVECAYGVNEFSCQSSRVRSRIDEGGLMAATVHEGAYDKMDGAYAAVKDWMDKNAYGYTSIMRDRFIRGPGQVPENNYLTAIYWPVSLKR